MHAYSIEGWDSFLLGAAGAAAALTGLVFVALSINMTKILAIPGLASRAGETIATLAEALIVALVGLIPQDPQTLAIELLLIGVGGWLLVTVTFARRLKVPGGASRSQRLGQFVLGQLATVPIILAGITLLVGSGGGMYWLALGMVFLMLNGISNAWVLLVEILR